RLEPRARAMGGMAGCWLLVRAARDNARTANPIQPAGRCACRFAPTTSNQLRTTSYRPRSACAQPARAEHATAGAGAVGAAAQQVIATGQHLLEETLVLECLAEHDAQHPTVPGVFELVDAGAPAIDEGAGVARVFF